ncbi:MAG TPA: DAK2 domain-containing protein [Candidatus Dormibacteraeota bacterium]
MKLALLGSLNWLAANQEEVNRLNVFPVPDGDTGTNMLLTLQSAVEDIKDSPATDVGRIARIAAHGSLMGARGNSGVILSQIFRGFAKAVEGKTELGPAELAAAFEEAANAAYRAVLKPTEGTILTVAREAGRSATAAAGDPRATVTGVIKAAAEGARRAVEKTPAQLQILRDAGVVDAGGFGLQVMLEGMLKSVQDADVDVTQITVRPVAQTSMELPEEGWGYCTEFLIAGEGLDVDRIREAIAALGDSVLVVGEPELVKVHVHTDDPPRVIGLAGGFGRLEKLNVGDMSTQHRRILEDAQPNGSSAGGAAPRQTRANNVGLVAVVSGGGLVEIFKGLGVDAIVQGGQTMNPSTGDLVSAVDGLGYDDVILLPNNKNVVLAAREVDKLASKRVHLVETISMPQGIAAVIAFNAEKPAADNAEAMTRAAHHVQTIEVTRAVRDTRSNGRRVKKGDVIAMVNDRLETAGADYAGVVADALQNLGPDKYELVTVYRGAEAGDAEVDALSASLHERFPGLEVEVQAGGQDHYPFIVSVE